MGGECKTRSVRFTTDEVATATRGEVVGPEVTIEGAAFDSRT